MQLLPANKRDPVSMLLVAAAIFIVLFIGFDLLRGMHRYHGTVAPAVEKHGPAGVLAASLSVGGLEVGGWAPPQASVRISDHDKEELGATTASAEGNWRITFPYDRHSKSVQILDIAVTKDGKTADAGKLGIFASGKAYEDAYIWWGGPAMNLLLQAPTGIEDADLFLVLAWIQPDKGILFAGNADPGDIIQIYADNEYIGTASAAGNGAWITPPILKPEKKTAELRLDAVHKESVVERRSYHLTWSDGKDGWATKWPSVDDGKETIFILKPEAGEASAPDEEKPGQVMPVSNSP